MVDSGCVGSALSSSFVKLETEVLEDEAEESNGFESVGLWSTLAISFVDVTVA